MYYFFNKKSLITKKGYYIYINIQSKNNKIYYKRYYKGSVVLDFNI